MKRFLTGLALAATIIGNTGVASAAWYDQLFGNLGECLWVATADSVIFPNSAGNAVILLQQQICW